MTIYTRLGDKGYTYLYGGVRLPKDHPLIEVLGTIDELNSILGYARSIIEPENISNIIKEIQIDLFRISTEIVCLKSPIVGRECRNISEEDVSRIELYIDELESELPKLNKFIVIGGSEASSLIHLARAICRRAERRMYTFLRGEGLEGHSLVLAYLNRLSDLLFVLARSIMVEEGVEEEYWTP